MSQSNIDLAWAAGFFDGEGNIRFNRYSNGNARKHQRAYGTLVIQLAQIDRRVLDRFQFAVGVGKVYGPYAPRQGNRRPVFIYSAAGHKAKLVYDLIAPYLSPVKIKQGEITFAEWNEQQSRPSSKYDRYKKCPRPV